MAAEPIWTRNALAKLKAYASAHGLRKDEVMNALSSGTYAQSPIAGMTQKEIYLKHRGYKVGVMYKTVKYGQIMIVSCWSYPQ